MPPQPPWSAPSASPQPRLMITPSSPGMADPKCLAPLGRSIGLAVEMVASVGEAIMSGEENCGDMQEACRDARTVAVALEKHCEMGQATEPMLRRLLAAVTRILLLADNVVVKQLLNQSQQLAVCSNSSSAAAAAEAASSSSTGGGGGSGENNLMSHFNEFVKAFCDFGSDMLHLIRLTTGSKGLESCRPREERWVSQIDSARLVLERSSTLLMSSSKAFARHPESPFARENRDTVFCQMRRALDLVHFIVKAAVMESYGCKQDKVDLSGLIHIMEDDDDDQPVHELAESTVISAIKYLEESVEIMRLTIISDSYKDQLTALFDSIVERTQDFTDSAYTSDDHRHNILMLCDRARGDLGLLLSCVGLELASDPMQVDNHLEAVLKTMRDLRQELQATALELAAGLLDRGRAARERVHAGLVSGAVAGDPDALQMATERLAEHIDFVEDVAKLVRHVTRTESGQVRARHAQINLHIYGPQVGVAAALVCRETRSKVAKENLEAFSAMWQWLVSEVMAVSKQEMACVPAVHPLVVQPPPPPSSSQGKFSSTRSVPDLTEDGKFVTGPPPGVQTSCCYLAPPGMLTSNTGLEARRHSTSNCMPRASRPEDQLNAYSDYLDTNEMVKRAKKMAGQAEAMFAFTRGEGKVKTTQDLFTLAEYFAEECNVIYKVIRLFSYDVPSGEDKRRLMALADHVPKRCHQLQRLIQSPTVGKAATFTKVDSIIREARQIIYLVLTVIHTCYSHAKKYNLDFRNVSLEGRGNTSEDSLQTFGGSSESARRGAASSGSGAANKKTRVSFILSGGY